MEMSDYGAKITDKEIKRLERELASVYAEAERDLQAKLDEFTKRYRAKEAIYREKLKNGEITQAQYNQWLKGQLFQAKQWKLKQKEVQNILTQANQASINIINGRAHSVFADNVNYMSYTMERGAGVNFGFVLYDRDAVANLVANNPKILPEWKINKPKDYIWNKKKVNRQITQGIIQGESLEQIAKRLATNLSTQNLNHVRTFARTAMTGAQNSGRNFSLTRARDLGINVTKEWMATLDLHTRDSHRHMDGEKIPVGDEFRFSNGLRYPGDPDGPAHEVFNCRCTMVGDLTDYPSEYQRYDNIDGKPIKNMTYHEWQRAKQGTVAVGPLQSALGAAKTVQEVNNIINSQGWFKTNPVGITSKANLDGCDLDSAKSIAASYQQVFEKYPKLKGQFNAPDASPRGMRNNTYAWCYTRGDGKIQVNPNRYNNWAKISRDYENDVASGWHPFGTTAESIITHEIGHAIDGLLARRGILGGHTSNGEFRYASSSLKTKVMNGFLKEEPNWQVTIDIWGKKEGMTSIIHDNVSQYATRNNREWFAECFAEYITSANPRTVARLFGKELEKLIGRLE